MIGTHLAPQKDFGEADQARAWQVLTREVAFSTLTDSMMNGVLLTAFALAFAAPWSVTPRARSTRAPPPDVARPGPLRSPPPPTRPRLGDTLDRSGHQDIGIGETAPDRLAPRNSPRGR